MLIEADNALAKKKYKEAFRLYQESLDKGEDKMLSYLGLSMSAYHNEEYEMAEKYALIAKETNPIYYKPYLVLSYIYAKQGNYKDSEIQIRRALDLSRENSDVLAFGGGLLVSRNAIDEGRIMLEKAISLNPNDWMAHYNLGSLLLLEKRYRESSREFLLSYKIRKSILALEKLLIINLFRYWFALAAIFIVLTLVAFYTKSFLLLLLPTIPIVITGLDGVMEGKPRSLVIILLGVIPLLLFLLVK
jgi:tetratricopeptide (TPR) repeat protein